MISHPLEPMEIVIPIVTGLVR